MKKEEAVVQPVVATDEIEPATATEDDGEPRGMNPFGEPITDETLRKMTKYKDKTITQEDRVREAMNMINAKGKNMEALEQVLDYKKRFGIGTSTLCMVYNATGETIELVDKMNWYGNIWRYEPPKFVQNGQWVAFLHVNPDQSKWQDSCGARVFRTTNMDGLVRDFLVAWCTYWHIVQNNAYTEVRGKDHFPQYWGYLYDLFTKSKKISKDETDQHFTSTVSIGGITSPEFIAILEHKHSSSP